jgi:protein-tyrosine phosphatase
LAVILPFFLIANFGFITGDDVMATSKNKLLFLCTGNYYRSRFAEMYFRHLANQHGLDWTADSRGLRISSGNVGPLSCFTQQWCDQLGIDTGQLRHPLPLTEPDLQNASLTIAVKATEHRPLIQTHFPDWEQKIEYWEIHDLDVATAEEALPILKQHVDDLYDRLRGAPMEVEPQE